MTREEKIKVLAALDGVSANPIPCGFHYCGMLNCGEVHLPDFKPYLTSYDAIVPLIQKQPHDVRIDMEELLMSRYWCAAVQHTAEELADALIKAVGKWRD